MAEVQVLIVEDENIVAKDLQNRLKLLGYTVVAIASSGQVAIEKATELRPDLVLIDIRLEGEMDGIAAAEQIRYHLDIPVIYLTAYTDEDTLQRAKITEPFGYLLKPFEEKELRTTIEIALYKHQMERKLRESEQWFAMTLRCIGDGVIATDKQGYIKFMNPVAETLTGWKQEEACGKNLTQVFHIVNEETRTLTGNPVTKVLQDGVVVGLANHTLLIARDGTERPIHDSAAPILDDKGGIVGVILVFRDITQQRNLEEELIKTSKLESIGILAGGIAHDFNNILTAILLNISLAKVYAKPEDKIFKSLIEAEKASIRARDLTQRLLTFSTGGAPIKKTAPISEISEIIKTSADFALRGSNIRCEFSIPDLLWLVEFDEAQMRQVIHNLVLNAQQAMPEGGTIEIGVKIIEVGTEGEQDLSLQEGKYLKISIKDQGIGIPKEHLSKIFDPYFTTKRRGSGLGLTTAYSIVKKHGGHLKVESKLGEGTTFFLYLPVSKE